MKERNHQSKKLVVNCKKKNRLKFLIISIFSVEEETVSSTTLDELKPSVEPTPVPAPIPAPAPELKAAEEPVKIVAEHHEDQTDEVPMDLE